MVDWWGPCRGRKCSAINSHSQACLLSWTRINPQDVNLLILPSFLFMKDVRKNPALLRRPVRFPSVAIGRYLITYARNFMLSSAKWYFERQFKVGWQFQVQLILEGNSFLICYSQVSLNLISTTRPSEKYCGKIDHSLFYMCSYEKHSQSSVKTNGLHCN
jgi:hypothetical protein